MNKRVEAKGNYVIICRGNVHYKEVEDLNFILEPQRQDEEFFPARIMSIGEYEKEESKIHPGDIVLVRNNNFKMKLGSNKPGVIYVIEYDDIICTIEDVEEEDYS